MRADSIGSSARLTVELGGEVVKLDAGDVLSLPNNVSYSDTSDENVEAIAREIRSGIPWRDAVHRRVPPLSPWLERCVTEPDRDLFFRGQSFSAEDRVLDVGAGWGQLAIPLAHRVRVCAVEPKLAKIGFQQAVAKQEGVLDNLWFVNADYCSVVFLEPFQVVILNGVLEWVGQFSSGDPYSAQSDFLEKVHRELAPGGRCIIGIENRVGLKYLLGTADDHSGMPGASLYDRELATEKYYSQTGRELRTFTYTMAEYRQLLESVGFDAPEFYAVFPDYKVPAVFFPVGEPRILNEYFLSGGFVREHSGLDGADLPIQEELRSLYMSFAELGIAHHFAPSYYIVARRGAESRPRPNVEEPGRRCVPAPTLSLFGKDQACILRVDVRPSGQEYEIDLIVLTNRWIPEAYTVVRGLNRSGRTCWERCIGPQDLPAGEINEILLHGDVPPGRYTITAELVSMESGICTLLDQIKNAGSIRIAYYPGRPVGYGCASSVEVRCRGDYAEAYRGEAITFAKGGNARPYELGGWSTAEDWVCWTDGPEAGLLLRFVEPPVGALELIADVHPFCPDGKLTVAVVANGSQVEEWHFDGPDQKMVRARIPIRGAILHLRFRIDCPRSPAELGLSEDNRALGLAFRWLQLSDERGGH